MNQNMWYSGSSTKGYCEYFNVTSLARLPETIYGSNFDANTMFVSTNCMMMFANEMIIWANRSFWDIWGLWIIVGSVMLIAIIAIVILVNRRRNVGTKLSKTVKGLISEA
jgi:hypothetical protein